MYEFQAEIFERFKDQPCAGLFMDVGTGKSTVLANLVRYKMNTEREILRTVIFCPIVMTKTWKDELLASTNIPAEMIGVICGDKNKRLKLLNNDKIKVVLINYEATRSEEIDRVLNEFKPEIVVLDESQMIKSRTSKTYKKIMKLSKHAKFKYILTATPIGNNAEDVWAQLMFLDAGETYGSRFYDFKGKYFINKNEGWTSANAFPSWSFNESLIGEFKERLTRNTITLEAKDCLDLPELVTAQIKVEMSPEQAKHYKEIKNDLITFIDENRAEGGVMVVKNALTKLLRLNGIISGFMTLEDGTIFRFKQNPRIDALMGAVEGMAPHKVLIFAVFSANYEDIRKGLEKRKIEFVEITGEVSTKKKHDAVDKINDMSNKCRVCLIHPKSGGAGITLTAAKYSIFYSRGFSVTNDIQSRGRNYRVGSIDLHDTIFHYDIVTPETIDETILYSLMHKKKFASDLLTIKKLLEV